MSNPPINVTDSQELNPHYNNLILDFLIIFNQDGIPIFSKCYSDICALFNKNDLLLSGFLSAITSFPVNLGYSRKELKMLDLGRSRMYFSYSNSSNIVFVIGVNKESVENIQNGLINISMDELQKLFDTNFPGIDWSRSEDYNFNNLEIEINTKIIYHWFKATNTHDSCPLGDNCPFYLASKRGRRKQTMWKSLRSVYSDIKRKINNQ